MEEWTPAAPTAPCPCSGRCLHQAPCPRCPGLLVHVTRWGCGDDYLCDGCDGFMVIPLLAATG